MKEKLYTIADIPVSIIRAVIGFAVAIPAVVICAMLDRLSTKLLINAGYDPDCLKDTRNSVAYELCSLYCRYSNVR